MVLHRKRHHSSVRSCDFANPAQGQHKHKLYDLPAANVADLFVCAISTQSLYVVLACFIANPVATMFCHQALAESLACKLALSLF